MGGARPPDPAPVEGPAIHPSESVGRALAYGFGIGAVTGAVTGLAGFGPLGAVVGAFAGAMLAAIPAAAGAAVIGSAARKADPRRYGRVVDLTLGVLGLGWMLLAIAWVAADALIGDVAPVLSMLTVAVGLGLARRSLHP